jgi:predicted transcriptional regulator
MAVDVTVEIDEALMLRLDALVEETKRSRDLLIREAIEQYVSFEATQIVQIREGMAQLDRGEFATEAELDAIEAEIESLVRQDA